VPLLAISAVVGAHNRLNTMTNQTAMRARAPADSTRTAELPGPRQEIAHPALLRHSLHVVW